MNNSEIAGVFSRTYKGARNFITPNVVEYGKAGKLLYELSKGKRIFGEGTLYGVTFLTQSGDKCKDTNDCFYTIEEAREHIKFQEGVAA
jgi:hypothetical protein